MPTSDNRGDRTLQVVPACGAMSENSACPGDGQPFSLHLARPNVGQDLVADEEREDLSLHLSSERGTVREDSPRSTIILHLPPERGAVDGISTRIESNNTILHCEKLPQATARMHDQPTR